MRPFVRKPHLFFSRPFGDLAATLSVFGASLFAVGGVLLGDGLLHPAFARQDVPKAYAVPNEIVIWVPEGITTARVSEIAASAGCEVVANLASPSPYYLLRIKGTTRTLGARKNRVAPEVGVANGTVDHVAAPNDTVLQSVEKLKAAEAGLLADPNWVGNYAGIQTGTVALQDVVPNDTFYPQQWDMRLINMPQAWKIQTNTKTVIAAVIDTGFDVTHPDFKRDGVNSFETPISVINPAAITTDVTDTDGHGTHVSGTVAAVANNALGIAGVGGFNGNGVNIRLLPVKADDIFDGGQTFFGASAVVAGIVEAQRRGAQVINMSIGFSISPTILQRAVTTAINSNVVIVAAAGNESSNTARFGNFPSEYAGVISVTSVDRNSVLSSFSNFGGNTTIAAPGGDFDEPLPASETQILSTFPVGRGTVGPGREYTYEVGTSMASPHVAGAAALLIAAGAQPSEVRGLLIGSARTLPAPGTTDPFSLLPVTSAEAYGAGLLDVNRALRPRFSLLGGNQLGEVINGILTSDRQTTYTRRPTFSVGFTGVGSVIREIGANAAQTSLVLRIETATTPSTVVQTRTIIVSDLPTQATGESVFNTKAFSLPALSTDLAQGRYKATLTLTYLGSTSSQTQFFEVRDYNQPTGLTLFSIPFQPTTATGVSREQQVLGVTSGYSVQRWNPLNPAGTGDSVYARYVPGDTARDDAYARFANQFHVADPLHPERAPVPLSYGVGNPTASLAPIGVGYWVNLTEARVLQTTGVGSITPVAIPLFGVEDDNSNFRGIPGWNLIGAPFEFPVNWSSVSIRQNTPTGVRDYTLQEAIAAEIINAQLVGWDVPTRSYNFNVFPGGQLLPFKAYWVRALRDCTIIVPPSRAEASLTSRAASSGVPMQNGWRVRIAATVAGDRDAQNYFGQTPGATDGEDKFDIAKPPTGPGYADVRFLGTDKRGKAAAYAYDMRPAKAGKRNAEWTMAVGAGKGDTDVTLTWDGLNSLPGRAKLSLRDSVTGRVVSMNGRSSYTYKNTEAGATRLFAVSLKEQNTAGPLQIRNVRAVPVGGTRGVTRGVSIRFGLSQEANITGRITTFSGKVVGNLLGAGRATSIGDVQLRWDGRSVTGSELPAGSYYVEITAQNDEGESTTVKQPITVLR